MVEEEQAGVGSGGREGRTGGWDLREEAEEEAGLKKARVRYPNANVDSGKKVVAWMTR